MWSDYCATSPPFTTSSDISPCLQSSTLMLLPPLLFFVITGPSFTSLYHRPLTPYPSPLLTSRTLLILCILLLYLISIIHHLVTAIHEPFRYVEYGYTMCAWGYNLAVIVMSAKRQLPIPKMVRLFWILESLVQTKSFESHILWITHENNSISIDTLIIFVMTPCTWILAIDAIRTFMPHTNDDVEDEMSHQLIDPISDMEHGEIISHPITITSTQSDATWQRFLHYKDEVPDIITHDTDDTPPSSHPLSGTTIEIPSWMEVTVSNRTIVHFSVRVTSSNDTFTVWRKHRDFQHLHDMMSTTLQQHPQHGIRLPTFPAKQKRSTLEPWRASLEKYINIVMKYHILWDDIARFVNLEEHIQEKSVEVAQNITSVTSTPNVDMKIPSSVPGYDWILTGVSVTGWSKWVDNTKVPLYQPFTNGMNGTTDKSNANFFVTFQLSIRSTIGDWTLHKRITELEQLRSDLAHRFPHTSIPSLNIRSSWDHDERSLELTRRSVEMFIQSLVGNSMYHVSELYACLERRKKNGIGHKEKNLTSSTSSNSVLSSSVPESPVTPAFLPMSDSADAVSLGSWQGHQNQDDRRLISQAQASHDTPSEHHRFQVTIPMWSLADPSNPKSHVVYTIVIREFFSLINFIEWKVVRRYTQFEMMHQKLRAMFPDVPLPELPKKTILQSTSTEFLMARLHGLESYLRQIINTSQFQVDEMFSFFDMNSGNRECSVGTLAMGAVPTSQLTSPQTYVATGSTSTDTSYDSPASINRSMSTTPSISVR